LFELQATKSNALASNKTFDNFIWWFPFLLYVLIISSKHRINYKEKINI
jgi:hypothetical protein